MLDQVYHGPMPLEGSTTDVLAKVQNQYFSLPHVPNTVSSASQLCTLLLLMP